MAGLKFGGSVSIDANSTSDNLLVGTKLQQLFREGAVRLRARVMTVNNQVGLSATGPVNADLSSKVTSSYVSGQNEIASDVPVNGNTSFWTSFPKTSGGAAGDSLFAIGEVKGAVGLGDEVFEGLANAGVQQWRLTNGRNSAVTAYWTAEVLG